MVSNRPSVPCAVFWMAVSIIATARAGLQKIENPSGASARAEGVELGNFFGGPDADGFACVRAIASSVVHPVQGERHGAELAIVATVDGTESSAGNPVAMPVRDNAGACQLRFPHRLAAHVVVRIGLGIYNTSPVTVRAITNPCSA
jgi:hypothetical protein